LSTNALKKILNEDGCIYLQLVKINRGANGYWAIFWRSGGNFRQKKESGKKEMGTLPKVPSAAIRPACV